MACGVLGEELIVRVGPQQYVVPPGLARRVVFDFSGRPMAGWVTVAPAGYASEEDLTRAG